MGSGHGVWLAIGFGAAFHAGGDGVRVILRNYDLTHPRLLKD